MALPTRQPLEDILRTARHAWGGVKRLADARAAQFAGNSVRAGLLLEVAEDLRGYRQTLMSAASAPGLAAYAQAEYADENYDIAADFTTMLAAMADVRDWIVANFPKNGGGYLLREQIAASGQVTERTFAAAELSALVTLLQALSATIE